GRALAAQTLASGAAERKFDAICHAQGGRFEPGRARHSTPFTAVASGRVVSIDNRQLARIAKLAGAPRDAEAGVVCTLRTGDAVERGQPLFEVCARSRGELAYALQFAATRPDVVAIAAD